MFVYVFVCFSSWPLPETLAWASPESHRTQLCFPKALSLGLLVLSVRAGSSQGTVSPIPTYVKKQGPENACVAFEKLQAGFPGTVLIIFTCLYTSPHPEIEASFFFFFPAGIAILYWLVGISKLLSIGLPLNPLQNRKSVSRVSNIFVSPVVLNAGLGRRI